MYRRGKKKEGVGGGGQSIECVLPHVTHSSFVKSGQLHGALVLLLIFSEENSTGMTMCGFA